MCPWICCGALAAACLLSVSVCTRPPRRFGPIARTACIRCCTRTRRRASRRRCSARPPRSARRRSASTSPSRRSFARAGRATGARSTSTSRSARRYRLQVAAVPARPAVVAHRVPARDAGGLSSSSARVSDADAYVAYAGEIAAHARGVIDDWEIRNEPDGRWAYLGTAQRLRPRVDCRGRRDPRREPARARAARRRDDARQPRLAARDLRRRRRGADRLDRRRQRARARPAGEPRADDPSLACLLRAPARACPAVGHRARLSV